MVEASDGRYRVKTNKVRFRYNPLTISATGFQLLPVDSTHADTYYSATADSLFVEVIKLWPLITNKNFALGKVHLIHPMVRVYDTDTTSVTRKPLNLALADIQHALVSTLSAFNVEKCKIDNAGLTYLQSKQGSHPFSVNHIYLDINNLHAVTLKNKSDSAVNFEADIRLFIDKPFIQLPDTSANLYLENLLLDTKQNVFTVNRFNLFQNNNNGTVDSINLSNIKLRNFNWPRWLKEGVVEVDTLTAYDGATFFDFSDKEIFSLKDKRKPVNKRILTVPMILHAVEVSKISYSLRTGSPSGPLNIQLNGDSLGISEVLFRNDDVKPLQVGNLAFKVTGYTNNYDNAINESTFEKLIIDHNDLVLINYYRSLNGKRRNSESSITIPSLRVINFSFDDLLKSKLKADNLILDNPKLVIDIQQSEKKRDADATVAAIANSLQPSLDIRHLSIHNSTIILLPKRKTAGKVTIENLNTEIDARHLLASKSVMDIIGSATALSTSFFNVTGDNVNLKVERSKLNNTQNGVYLQQVSGNIGRELQIDLQGISIEDKNNKFDITKLQQIQLDNVSIEKGRITINSNPMRNKNVGVNKTPAFDISNIQTGPLEFDWIQGNKNLHVADIKISGSNLLFDKGKASWKNVNIATGITNFNTPSLSIKASGIVVNQPGSFIANDVVYKPTKASGINSISVPILSVKTSLVNSLSKDLVAEEVTLYKPEFIGSKQVNEFKSSGLQLPDFYIRSLLIDQPVINFQFANKNALHSIASNDSKIIMQDVESKKSQNTITANSLQVQLIQPVFNSGKTMYQPASVSMKTHALSYNTINGKLLAFVDSAEVKDLSLETGNEHPFFIGSASAGLHNYTYSSSDSMSLPYLLKHADWWSNAETVKQQSGHFALSVYNPYVSAANPFFSMDSLTLIPLLDKDSFWRSTPIEKDYNTLRLGYTQVRNWQLSGNAGNRKFNAGFLVADRLNFLTEKDKTHGPDTVTYRPLLASSFKNIPLQFSLDTIQVTNGYVKHTLLPEKSKRQANIFFSDINGFMYNVKNYNYHQNDSLRVRMRAQIMGQGDLLLGFKQSYVDTIQGFVMRARMGRMPLAALNPLLVPIVSVKIDRGIIDSMLLIVGANDFVAYGSMDMRYHNLRLSILKKGEKKYFLSSFFNWVINIPVRSNDDSRKNTLYQERLRNKGIYNYWSKIAISGLLTNLGVKRDKKQERKYNKAIRRDIPAVSGDF